LRVITDAGAAAALPALLQLAVVRKAVAAEQLVTSRVVPKEEWPALLAVGERADAQMVLEHGRIPFPSFPYEWPAGMLHAAGRLTLDLALALLEEGHGLKDATPYNVLFSGAHPVFVDLCSLEGRDPDDYTWLAHAQFVRTFLLPLLAHRDLGVPLAGVFLAEREGLEPEVFYRMVGPLRRLMPPYLGLVSLPTWLARAAQKREAALYEKKRGGHPERSCFILAATLRRQLRSLDRLAPTSMRASRWSNYMQSGLSYGDAAFKQKEAFVRQALQERRAERVLDVGCNTGHFSRLAAASGASVVAVDSDPSVVGQTWRCATAENLNILPLVVDLARPSPGTGWRNAECPPFLERAKLHFDLVLMLAVVHHLLVTDRIPLQAVVDLVADLTSDRAVIEYVGPSDPCFRRIARGRDSLHASLSTDVFEAAFQRCFRIERSEQVHGLDRRLYLMTRQQQAT